MICRIQLDFCNTPGDLRRIICLSPTRYLADSSLIVDDFLGFRTGDMPRWQTALFQAALPILRGLFCPRRM